MGVRHLFRRLLNKGIKRGEAPIEKSLSLSPYKGERDNRVRGCKAISIQVGCIRSQVLLNCDCLGR